MTIAGLAPLDFDPNELLKDLNTVEVAIEKFELELSLHKFVQAAWKLVEPTQDFTDNWHIRKLCWALEQVYYAQTMKTSADLMKYLRMIVNVPPGTMKSLLISVFFPAWVWTRDPGRRFLMASYGQHLTTRDNLRCRQLVESQWYQDRWPVKLLDDQNTKTRYNTLNGGWRIATSVGGVGTGEHPDFIVIDDPTNAAQAASDAERLTANLWFDQTIAIRQGRRPAMIVVMQRLHEEDLAGHLLKKGGWVHVRWPMRFERCTCPPADPLVGEIVDAVQGTAFQAVGNPNGVMHPDESKRCPLHKANPDWTPDELDERTTAGDLLWPGMFDEQRVRQAELDLGPYAAAGQLQQRPAPEGGGLFKRENFKFFEVAPQPTSMRMARGWDTAATEGGGDYTVGVLIGEEFEWVLIPAAGERRAKREYRSTGRFYVLDVIRKQLGPNGVDTLMKTTAEQDKVKWGAVAQRELREPGSSGKIVTNHHAKMLAGHDYEEVTIGVNKVTAAKPFRSQVEAGNVYLPKGAPWAEEYLKELANFPTGKHDDQVDGSSCSFNAVLLEDPPRKRETTW